MNDQYKECPKCGYKMLHLYATPQGGQPFPENANVGRCRNCSYKYTPDAYYRNNPDLTTKWYKLHTEASLMERNHCPCCGRLHTFIPFIRVKTGVTYQADYGKCNHLPCSYQRIPEGKGLKEIDIEERNISKRTL